VPEIGSTRVLVVDNDPDASARQVLEAIPGIDYVHEPVPGISAGRNRALDESGDADLLVFIDDDERPRDGWLTTLVTAKRELGADAVVGRVKRVFAGPIDPWITAGGFFPSIHLPTGTPVAAAATNNLLLDLAKVREFGLRFDGQFGLSGGSDTHFTRAFIACGGTILWCDEAVVDDQVPVLRANRRWVLRRAYRGGNSDARVNLALANSPGSRSLVRVRSICRGLPRVLGGFARVLLGRIARRQAFEATGARTAARGLGMLAASVGRNFHEYGRVDG
jgi:glycosyltransferase involved in cell wall biosynthesis